MSALRARLPSPAAIACGLVLLGLYAPIVLVVVNSLNANENLTGWGGLTLDWYSQALGDERVIQAFLTSLVIALASTLLSLGIGTTAALWARRASRRGRAALDASTYMRILLPEVVFALGLFVILDEVGIGLGAAAIVAGHVVINSAYATLLISARLASMPGGQEDAAADLGARPTRVFRRVTLPLIAPALLVAALLTATFSFDDVVTSQFLGGAEAETLPVLLLGKIRIEVSPEVNAIGVLVMAVTVLTFAAAALAATRRNAR